jgi:hypothetical protein
VATAAGKFCDVLRGRFAESISAFAALSGLVAVVNWRAEIGNFAMGSVIGWCLNENVKDGELTHSYCSGLSNR